jgi:epoxyqueuosine reductase
MSQTDPAILAAQVKRFARGLGFDLVGIAPAGPSRYRDYFRTWLDAGRAGTMHYLAERFDERVNPATYLRGARSVVCVAVNYHVPPGTLPAGAVGRVARYARGLDYHDWMKPKLYAIADWLRDIAPGTQTVCGVDTAPVLERELAARAGIGWVGKNTLVLNERIGSWLLLGEVITTLDLPPDPPAVDRCGNCTRCIDACPTRAIDAPYQLNAARCISYLTIENAGEIEPALRPFMGDWIFGCDICQDVCPFNRRAPIAELAELQPRVPPAIGLDQIDRWQKDDFDRTFRRTAVKRIRLPILKRNAAIARANQHADSGT